MTIHLTINDQSVAVAAGTTIWEASRRLGVDIPVLCHQLATHHSPTASSRFACSVVK